MDIPSTSLCSSIAAKLDSPHDATCKVYINYLLKFAEGGAEIWSAQCVAATLVLKCHGTKREEKTKRNRQRRSEEMKIVDDGIKITCIHHCKTVEPSACTRKKNWIAQ